MTTKNVHYTTAVLLLLLIPLTWSCVPAHPQPTAHPVPDRGVDVFTTTQLYSALQNSGVTDVHIQQDLDFLKSSFEGLTSPLPLICNLTLHGQSQWYPTLNFQFLTNRLTILPGCSLTFKHLLLKRATTPLKARLSEAVSGLIATSVTFVGDSPGGTLLILDAAVEVYAASLDALAAPAFGNVARPAAFPGTQLVQGLTDMWCLPGVHWDLTLNPISGSRVCWQKSHVLVDVALEGHPSTPAVQGPTNSHTRVFQRAVLVYEEHMSQSECLAQFGPVYCSGQVMHRLLQSEDQQEQQQSAQQKRSCTIAAVLPAVLGGVALVCVAVGVACLWSRRKRAALHRGTADTTRDASHSSEPAKGDMGDADSAATGDTTSSTGRDTPSLTGTRGHIMIDIPSPGTDATDGPSTSDQPHSARDQSNGSGFGRTPQSCATVTSVTRAVAADTRMAVPLNLNYSEVRMSQRLRGSGQFGQVVEAEYQGRKVAVKVIHPAVVLTMKNLKSFQHEATILSRCSHPNIVTLLGAGLTPPHVFLVEELLDECLRNIIYNPKLEFGLAQALSISRDVALGLAYLHPTILHRDLKPGNILLDSAGHAKISDFGLARLRESTLVTTDPEAGTAAYLAPECYDPDSYRLTSACDIYSLGILINEMVTRRVPWPGMRNVSIGIHVCQGVRPALEESDERCPKRLRHLIQRCWGQDCHSRPLAAEVAEELTLIMQQSRHVSSCGKPP